MSHTVAVKTEIRDPVALTAACRRLGLAGLCRGVQAPITFHRIARATGGPSPDGARSHAARATWLPARPRAGLCLRVSETDLFRFRRFL